MLTPAVSKLGRKYGLRPSRADHPFLKTALRAKVAGSGPGLYPLKAVSPGFTCDYSPLLRPVRDQGNEGSCGPHAWCALKEFNCVVWALKQAGWTPGEPIPAVTPKLNDWLSVAHAYWNILKAEHAWPNDEGTDNATAASVFQSIGVCPERFLPYVPGAMTPGNATCDTAGAPYRIGDGISVPLDEAHIDATLADVKCVVLGFQVYASFEDTGPDGIVPPVSGGLMGGHDTLICGKRSDGLYKVRNSWGAWGDGGYFYVSSLYIAGTGMDGWTTT